MRGACASVVAALTSTIRREHVEPPMSRMRPPSSLDVHRTGACSLSRRTHGTGEAIERVSATVSAASVRHHDWARGRPTAAASAELCLRGIAIIAAPYGVQALLKALLEHLELAARVAGGVRG